MSLLEQNKEALEALQKRPKLTLDLNKPVTTAKPRGAVRDVALAPFRGIAGAAGGVWELADWATGDSLPDFVNPFGESETAIGGVVEGLTEFATGFIPIFGALGKVGKLGGASKLAKTGRSLAAGVATDFTVYQGQEERLSNLIQQFPELQNPVTEYLAAKEDDSEVEGRLKNVLEGLGAGAVVDLTLKGLRALRGAGVLRHATEDPDALTVHKEAAKQLGSLEDLEKSIRSVTGGPAPAPTLRGEAKNFADTGEFNPMNFNGVDDTIEFIKQSWEEVRSRGSGTGKEPWDRSTTLGKAFGNKGATLDENITSFINDLNGGKAGGLMDIFEGSAQSVDDARIMGRVVQSLIVDLDSKIRTVAERAKTSGSLQDLAQVAKLNEVFHDMIVVSKNFGRAFGQGLAAQKKYFNIAELTSRESVDQLIENLGGQTNLAKYVDKISHTNNAIELATMMRKSMTTSGKALQIHNEWFIQSILSGPKTHLVNLSSNLMNSFFLPFERTVGALAKGDLTTAGASVMQYGYLMSSFVDGFKVAARAFKQGDNVLFKDSKIRDLQPNQTTQTALSKDKNPFQSAMEKIWSFRPTQLLMTSDEFFKYINFRSSAKMKLFREAVDHNRKNPSDKLNVSEFVNERFSKLITDTGEARSEASLIRQAISDNKGKHGFDQSKAIVDQVNGQLQETSRESGLKEFLGSESFLNEVAAFGKSIAEESTFTAPIESKLGKGVQNMLRAHPFMQIFVPFFRTPANILKFVGQRTFPVVSIDGAQIPIISGIHKRALRDLQSGDPVKKAALEGRLMTGMGFFGIAAYLVDNGIISGGGPKDRNEKKLLQETGWQEYSIEIGEGERLSFNRTDPFGIFFGLVADWYEVQARSEEQLKNPLYSVMASAVVAISSNIVDRSYLQGLSNLVDTLQNPEMKAPDLIKNHLGALVPNFLGQTSPAFSEDDPLLEARGLFDKMLAKLPGAEQDLEPVRNILGETVTNYRNHGSFSPLGGVDVPNWINPMVHTKQTDDFVVNELAKLQHGFTKPGIEYKGVNLVGEDAIDPQTGQSAYDRWLQLHSEVRVQGKSYRDTLSRLFRSREYKKLGDQPIDDAFGDPRILAVNQIRTKFKKAAWDSLLKERPQLKQKASLFTLNKTRARKGLPILQEI